MHKEYIDNEEEFKKFCSERRIGRDIESPPTEYPCIIVYTEHCGYYEYEYVYISDYGCY